MLGAGAIGNLITRRSCYIIEMGKKIGLKEIYSENSDHFSIDRVKIIDNYMEGLLTEAIKKWVRSHNSDEERILKMIDKLYLSYEQLSLLQYNQYNQNNLYMLENGIKCGLGIGCVDINNAEWCEVKGMLDNSDTLRNKRDELQINLEKKRYLTFALLGKFFANFYKKITRTEFVYWDEDITEFNMGTSCYYVYFKLQINNKGDKAQQELDKIMVELQEQLYELQDFLYCIKLNIKNVFLELQDDSNNIRHCDFDASVPRLIQLLTGTNIYCNEHSFVRELIQNSIDAISFRGKQKNPGENFSKSIEVELGCDEEKRQYLKIRDYGIGMKQEIIEQYFATLGKSYYKEYTERRNINYNSVSNFGIGFLSVFKPCNRIIIKTKHFVENKYHKLEIISDRGHYTISSCTQPDFLPGTEITCYFKRQDVDEKAIIDYIKEIMLDIKYSIKIRSGVGSGNLRYIEIKEREIRQEKYKNKMFVPFDEDKKGVAKLENEKLDFYSFRHGILIRPEHEKHAGVDILSAGILLKNAGLEDVFGEKMESLHYMKVTMNFPPNWLDIDVSREKVNGIREGYIKKAKDFKEDIHKELKRQMEEAFQKKEDVMLGFYREAVMLVNFFGQNSREDAKQNVWNLKMRFEKDVIKFQLNNERNESILNDLFYKWVIKVLPEYDNVISERNHKTVKLKYKSFSQDEASAVYRMLRERKNSVESRETLLGLGLNVDNVNDKYLPLVSAVFLDDMQEKQEKSDEENELLEFIETVVWENCTVWDATEKKDDLFTVSCENGEQGRIDMESETLQNRIDIIAKQFNNKVSFTNRYDFIWNYIIWKNSDKYVFSFKDNGKYNREIIQSRYERLRDSIRTVYLKGTGKLLDIYTIASCYMSVLMEIPKDNLKLIKDTDVMAKYRWILDVGLGFLYMWILSEDEKSEKKKSDMLYLLYSQKKLESLLEDRIKNRFIQLLASQEKRSFDVLCFAELLRCIDDYIKNQIQVQSLLEV